MIKDDPKAKDDAVFALLGRAATNLASLEFAVSELLQVLIDPDEAISAAVIAEDMPLARKVQHMRKLAALRFILDDEMRTKLGKLARRLDRQRSRRNLFIHGLWRLTATPKGGVDISCVDHRWDIDPKMKQSWSRMREESWSLSSLRDFITRIRDLTQETLDVKSEVRKKMKAEAQQAPRRVR